MHRGAVVFTTKVSSSQYVTQHSLPPHQLRYRSQRVMARLFSLYFKFRPVPRIKLVKKGIHAPLGKTAGNINRLVIDSFGPDDAGKYKCRASDKAGQSDTKTTVINMEGIRLLFG